MRKPVLYVCGAIAAYSLWKWFSFSFLRSSLRKTLEDDSTDDTSRRNSDIVDSLNSKYKASSGDQTLYSPMKGETDFTIMSSHAYDFSEETDVQSHKDSFHESKASFLKDGFVVEAGHESPMKPVEFEEI